MFIPDSRLEETPFTLQHLCLLIGYPSDQSHLTVGVPPCQVCRCPRKRPCSWCSPPGCRSPALSTWLASCSSCWRTSAWCACPPTSSTWGWCWSTSGGDGGWLLPGRRLSRCSSSRARSSTPWRPGRVQEKDVRAGLLHRRWVLWQKSPYSPSAFKWFFFYCNRGLDTCCIL